MTASHFTRDEQLAPDDVGKKSHSFLRRRGFGQVVKAWKETRDVVLWLLYGDTTVYGKSHIFLDLYRNYETY